MAPVSTGGAHEWDQLRTEHELALLLRLRRRRVVRWGSPSSGTASYTTAAPWSGWLTNYVHLLETLARGLGSPEQAVPSLSLLTDKEERALLDTFSGRHVARALEGQTSDENLVDIMERQCRRSPDATAVVDDRPAAHLPGAAQPCTGAGVSAADYVRAAAARPFSGAGRSWWGWPWSAMRTGWWP